MTSAIEYRRGISYPFGAEAELRPGYSRNGQGDAKDNNVLEIPKPQLDRDSHVLRVDMIDFSQELKRRYLESAEKVDTVVVDKATSMISAIKRATSTSFLENVSEYKATQSMSLVFEMAPGYRELYKYHLMLKRGLSINGDVFKVSMKDIAQLYEYWCFIKLVSIMKKQDYRLFTDDVIKVDKSGVTVTLVKGRASEVKFINPRTGEKITLTYNPAERNTPTVSQKPDNVLTLEKVGAEREYKYMRDFTPVLWLCVMVSLLLIGKNSDHI